MTRSRWVAIGLLVATFAAGGLMGGAVASRADDRSPERGRRGSGGREGYIERLNAELQLSPAQQDSIRLILQQAEPRMDSLWRELRPRFDSLRMATRGAIQGQLTADQLTKYNAMLERREREYRERRANGGGEGRSNER